LADDGMMNLRREIERIVGDEPIEGIVIGRFGSPDDDEDDFGAPERGNVPPDAIGTVVSWDATAPWLDYEFYGGFGAAECHPVYVWTPTRVIFVHEYDGSSDLVAVPRHPVGCLPSFGGKRSE
jgi:hypothetical protein